MPDPTPDDLAVVVPTAPFAKFEGEKVTEAVLKLAADLVLRRPIGRHGKTVVVVEVEVVDVAHKGNGDTTLKREETSKRATAYELPGKFGRRVLSAARHADRLCGDLNEKGRTPVDELLGDRESAQGEGFEVVADGSGVVMTPEEVAELGLDRAELDPRVVVAVPWAKLDGRKPGTGQKLIYPDETQALTVTDGPPQPGDRLVLDDGELIVVEVLDPVTGDAMGDEWTWEHEKARLQQQEADAVAEETGGLTVAQMENRTPWEGYDGAKVGAIVEHLDNLTAEQLRHVETYETAHKDRRGVLSAVATRIAELAQLAAQTSNENEVDGLADLDLPPLDDDPANPDAGEEG